MHPKYFRSSIAWAVLISLLFLLPGFLFSQDDTGRLFFLDKVVHFLSFYILGYLITREVLLLPEKKEGKIRLALILLGIGIIYGIALETFQLIPLFGRSFSGFDILFNILGVLTGFVIRFLWGKKNTFFRKKNLVI